MLRRLVPVLLVALFALPASAPAAEQGQAQASAAEPATVRVKPLGLHNGRAKIMSRVRVVGTLAPFAPNQKVRVSFFLNGRRIAVKTPKVRKGKGDWGVFRAGIHLRRGGKYAVSAHHPPSPQLRGDRTVRKSWKVRYAGLRRGQCNRVVRGFKAAMRRIGYVPGGGSCFNARTARAVLAYRKVNGQARNQHAGKGLVKRVFSGRGAYRVKHPGAGNHAEVDISRQILVIARGDKPVETYHVSTGAPATPTVRGHFRFQWKQPGYNNVGMYYSTYFHGGYAVHGYRSVPTYNASHGCVRVPIPDARHIYRQLDIGEDIFVSG